MYVNTFTDLSYHKANIAKGMCNYFLMI